MGDRAGELAAIAERSNLSMAAQIHYQCNVLALLRKLAAQNKGGLVIELLRDPIALEKRYKQEYDRDPGSP